MKVLFIARPDLFSNLGGDTVQINNTAKCLQKLGIHVDIRLSNDNTISYSEYDLLHLFNIIDCEDLLRHAIKTTIPYLISTIYVDYSEYDKFHRKDTIGLLARIFSTGFIEYSKTLAKFLLKGEPISSWQYFFRGHGGSIRYLLKNAACLLPNSNSEYQRLLVDFGIEKPYEVVVNAVDRRLFSALPTPSENRGSKVVCVGRLEGRKNQLNLIKASNAESYELEIIGTPSQNQKAYVEECYRHAGSNTRFLPFMSQQDLLKHYSSAKVHVLASWFETTGLSSLEAAAMGCNIVVADKGDVREYFGDLAYYCEPDNTKSISMAVNEALKNPVNPELKDRVLERFNWENAAEQTLIAYKKVLKHD